MTNAIRVTFLSLIMALVVGAGLVVLPAMVVVVTGHMPTDCGRACYDAGVTENPDITIPNGGE